MTTERTTTVFSDGWTTVDHHPIVNVIMGVRSLHTLCVSIDTMGQEKTMEFITDLILHHIKEIGEGRVFVVCMDGVCQGDFVLVQKVCPWVQCFVCVTDGIDNFLENVGTSVESIKIQENLMGDSETSEIEWNKSFFRDCFDTVVKVVTPVQSSHVWKLNILFPQVTQPFQIDNTRLSFLSLDFTRFSYETRDFLIFFEKIK